MRGGNDEDEERQRQKRERAYLTFMERIYGIPFRIADGGFIDGRSLRRTGRTIKVPIRVHPRMKSMIQTVMLRDNVPSVVMLFELAMMAYFEKEGDIDKSQIPSDEDLARQIEQKRDDDDAE